jgi:hypothetical protein
MWRPFFGGMFALSLMACLICVLLGCLSSLSFAGPSAGTDQHFVVAFGAFLVLSVVFGCTFGAMKRQNTKGGKCSQCGYDLRATPERCPECGHVEITWFE